MTLRGFRALAATGFLALCARDAAAADGIPVCVAAHDQYAPASTPDGMGGMYVAWLDQRLGYNTDVWLQRVGPSLQRATGWPDGGVAMTSITCTKTEIALVADESGVLATWADNRCNVATGFDIYAERFTPQGARGAGWPANGRLVFSAGADQLHPAIAGDGAGGAFVAWTDLGVLPRRIAIQHVLASGALDPAWPANGVTLTSTAPDSAAASLLADGAGGVLAAWEDTRSPDGDLWMQRLQGDGTPAAGWTAAGKALMSAFGAQFAPRLVSDAAGGAVAVWCDRRSGGTRLYAIRVDGAGVVAPGWNVGGAALSPGSGEQGRHVVFPDELGGAWVAWQDARSGTSAAWLQHLGGDGTPAPGWSTTGIAVAPAAAAQTAPALTSDLAGGMFVSWHDARSFGTSGADVYATHRDESGALVPGWPADGLPVCDAAGEQRDVRLAYDWEGGAFAVWTDARASATRGTDIAMASLGPSGPGATQVRALSALHHDGQTFLTWQPPAGTGWTYRIYRSLAAITTPAQLAGATLVGTVGDSSAYDRHVSQVLGTPYGWKIDSLAAELDPASGLFVYTAAENAEGYYAVTAQNSVFGENTSVTPGVNSLADLVVELLDRPRPVYQRTLQVGFRQPEFWTLFVSDRDTPLMDAMTNRPGMAWDCAIVRPVPHWESSLLVPLHFRGGSVLDAIYGTGYPGEWVLGLDDWLPNGQGSFWYGWADTYDVTSTSDTPATSGTVVDYTLRRMRFTLEWALRTFPIDTTRVYAFGYSMGGAGSVLAATHLADKFAATMSVVGKSDFAFLSDPDTTCWFNPNGNLRKLANALWGTVAANLPASEGGHVYEQLDAGWLAAHEPQRAFAPTWMFAGKLDNTMGWAENIHFMNDMAAGRRAGALYWEKRRHNENFAVVWSPMQDPRVLYRYRLDQSYPAVTNLSFANDPGDGVASHGDSIGTINGHVEWDTFGVDSALHWSRGIDLRNLTTLTGLRVPPDSCTGDVTLRRTRLFRPAPGEVVTFTVADIASNGRLAQSGTATADANGVVTLPGVKLFRLGSLVDVVRNPVASAPAPGAPHAGIALSRHPVRGTVELAITWPGAGHARAALYDVSGRQVRLLWSGAPKGATQALTLDSGTLPPGLYLIGAEAGGHRVSRRLVVLR
ncbi:MAG: hypothetical protein HZA61_04730 [Candidatus Eisenbacteria bacterium]|uniref:T9SS type A sorting domain-containing protein n=1 Tax=Eiseniibacteriota bacterium TaxID=2212470 RepID=A0A933W178_UNCEI|nr:hypothetical protein [Candidatus Eisenbacteria bacterium]